MTDHAANSTAPARPRVRRRLWTLLLGGVLLQVVLLGLVIALLDLFAHDLLCRYGASRWDPFERTCCVPTAVDGQP